MKRIFNIALTILAGGLLVSSCISETLAVFDPSVTKGQVLGGIQGCTLDADSAPIETIYDAAQFGVTAPVGYTLYVAPSGAEPIERKLNATIADGKITFTQKDLNTAILNMGGVADTEFSVDFQLVATLLNDKNQPIDIKGSVLKSNVVTSSFIPYDVEILDVDAYEHVWIIGSGATVGAWSHGNVYQYLYDYNKDGHTYTGMIYYGENAADGWKLTGIAGWDDSCNWGSEDQSEEAEASSITLISSGGSKDIKNYSKQFYMWSFDKNTLVLTKEFGFDRIGIVGSFNGWNADDADCVMNYNDFYHRFYLDWDFAEGGELKFTCDGSWDLNFGEGLAQGGPNIPFEAGQYRIYLDFNKGEYEFNAAKYGTEEPGAPLPDPDPVWSLIGTLNGDSWSQDIYMKEVESNVWKASKVDVTATDEFKIRYLQDWALSFGGPEENAHSTIDPENPYPVYKPTLGQEFSDEGTLNIMIGEAGKYDITYNAVTGKVLIESASADPVWSLIGVNGDWDNDINMTKLSSGVWVNIDPVEIEGSFKLRYNGGWDVNRGGDFEELGSLIKATQDGNNISVPEKAKYQIVYNPAIESITVNPCDWSVIGGWEESVLGSVWSKDLYMSPISGTSWYRSESFRWGSNDNGNKIRQNGDWAVSFGAATDDPVELGVEFTGEKNIKVPAENEFYCAAFNPETSNVLVLKAWCLIGQVNGSNWDADFPMTCVDEYFWVGGAHFEAGNEFKLRESGDWGVNRGGALGNLDEPFDCAQDGSNIIIPETGDYIINFDVKENKITIAKL